MLAIELDLVSEFNFTVELLLLEFPESAITDLSSTIVFIFPTRSCLASPDTEDQLEMSNWL